MTDKTLMESPSEEVAEVASTESSEQLNEVSQELSEETAPAETEPTDQTEHVEQAESSPEVETVDTPTEEPPDNILERLGGPERLQLIERLAQPGLEGKQGLEILEQIAPWNAHAIKAEATWSFLDDPASVEVMSQDLFQLPAETVKALTKAYAQGWIDDDVLQAPLSTLSEDDRREVDEAKAFKAQFAEREKQETQKQISEAHQEIFKSTLLPLEEIKKEFKFEVTAEDSKSPEVKELKEIASKLYDLYALGLMDSDPHSRQLNENLTQILSQGLEYKDQAKSVYAPDLTKRTRAAAARAGQAVNKLLTAALRGIQGEIQQKSQAPIEPGMSSGMGGGNGSRPKMPEPGTSEFANWASRGFNVAVSTNQPKI